jgi:hypothetical protein
MVPFRVNQSWYETYWYGHALHARWRPAEGQRSTRAKRIAAAAALLTAIGGGAALAQGTPPGFGPWQSGWPSYVESHQAHAANAGKATTAHPGGRAAMARNGEPAPFAGNAQDSQRRNRS